MDAKSYDFGRILVSMLAPCSLHFRSKIRKLIQREPKWHQKSEKRRQKMDAKNNMKSIPKGFQNDTKMDAEMVAFSYVFRKGENAPDSLFSNRRRGSGT